MKYNSGSYAEGINVYIFLDSNGAEMTRYSIKKKGDTEKVIRAMSAILKEKGKGVPRKKYKDLLSWNHMGTALFAIGWYDEAYKNFKKLAKLKVTAEVSIIEEAKKKLDEINSRAAELLKEAGGKIEAGNKAEALVDIYILHASCKALKIAHQIWKAISSLEEDEGITAENKKKAAAEAKACELYFRAEEYAAQGNARKARGAFERVVRSCKETSYCEKAKSRLEELE